MEDSFLDTYWEERNDLDAYSDPYDAIPFGDAQRFEDEACFQDECLERQEFEDDFEGEDY